MRPARRLSSVALAVLAVVVVALSPAVSGLGVSHALPAPAVASSSVRAGSTTSTATETKLTQQAESSLAQGAGPAAGRPLNCSAQDAGAFTCRGDSPLSRSTDPPVSGTPAVPSGHPAVGTEPAWYNVSAFADVNTYNDQGPQSWFSAAAYDPDYSEVVLFGGCVEYACPSNQTWTYSGGGWVNVTLSIAGHVPALYGMAMAWDPDYGAIIMAGGVFSNGSVVNWTYGFYGSEWYNWTSYVGPAATVNPSESGSAFAPMAWDPQLDEMVQVDGCLLANCYNVYDAYFVLTDAGWAFAGFGPTAFQGDAFLWGSSMAYDVVDQEMVFFGGFSAQSGVSVNVTYILNATGWWNETTSSRSCTIYIFSCVLWAYPQDRGFASMTWDGQLGEIVMFGGLSNSSGSELLNDTYYFVDNLWYESAFFTSVVGPLPEFGGAMPTNSTNITPVLIGGACTGGFCYNTTNVFEIPPQTVILSITPSPAETGIGINVTAESYLGSGPYQVWDLYDFEGNVNYSTNYNQSTAQLFYFWANFSYSSPGTFYVYAYVWDFWGVGGFNYTTLVVNAGVAVAPSSTGNPTEPGGTVSFSAGETGGMGTISYLWGFGDHSALGSGADPTHVYSTAGTYTAWVNATDSYGGWANSTVVVLVDPALAVLASPTPAKTDIDTSVSFTAAATEGSLTYTSYAWTFGDSTTGTGATTTHTYAAAGTYTVEVTVTDSLGFEKTAMTSVLVNPALAGSASASSATPTTANSVAFNATHTGGTGPYTFAWSFGDGATSTSENPSHKYASAGTYTVTVVITDEVGKSVTRTLTETVSKAPTVLGLPPTEGYGVIAAIVIVVVAALLAAALLMRRRRKQPGSSAPPAAWNQRTPGAPPSGAGAPAESPPPTGGAPPTPPPGAT